MRDRPRVLMYTKFEQGFPEEERMNPLISADDVWPILVKMPPEERTRLLDRLLSFDSEWLAAELDDLRDWSRSAQPGDAELLDPEGGTPFTWNPAP